MSSQLQILITETNSSNGQTRHHGICSTGDAVTGNTPDSLRRACGLRTASGASPSQTEPFDAIDHASIELLLSQYGRKLQGQISGQCRNGGEFYQSLQVTSPDAPISTPDLARRIATQEQAKCAAR